MLIIFQAFDNLTGYRLLVTHYKMLLDSYYHLTMNDFRKLLKQKKCGKQFKNGHPNLFNHWHTYYVD